MKKYIFKEKFFKITDKYWITDENGNNAFFLDQDFTFLGYRAAVYGANRDMLFSIEKKIISLLAKFFVDFEDGSKMTVNKRFTILRKSIDVAVSYTHLTLPTN